MPETDPACTDAKPKDKPDKTSDEKGVFLLVNPSLTIMKPLHRPGK